MSRGAQQPLLLGRGLLLFKADVAQVSVVDSDDAVVLLKEAVLLSLSSPLQTLDQQAKSPERSKGQRSLSTTR